MSATQKAIDSARWGEPRGRTTISRSTRRPIDAITPRNVAHRAATSIGVAAVSESEGIANAGAGPAFGPTANVNAPRTGWPSTEIARQKTRYQPCRSLRRGTSSSSGFAAERRGGPVVCWCPSALVTETTAKRGSTASEYTSATECGGVFTILLAAGTVRRSAACAHAVAGRASTDVTQQTSTTARLIGREA